MRSSSDVFTIHMTMASSVILCLDCFYSYVLCMSDTRARLTAPAKAGAHLEHSPSLSERHLILSASPFNRGSVLISLSLLLRWKLLSSATTPAVEPHSQLGRSSQRARWWTLFCYPAMLTLPDTSSAWIA